MSLHDKIINIPATGADDYDEFPNEKVAYKIGHRDARHEAAEMALGVEEVNTALVEALENLLAEWKFQMSSYEPAQEEIAAEKALLKAYKEEARLSRILHPRVF